MSQALTVLPNAALRALAESVKASPGESFLELSIRARAYDLNVREFSAYLSLLNRLYGRFDPLGFRSYAQLSERQLEIQYLGRGSIDLIFLFDLFHEVEIWRALLIYLIVRAGPVILRGEAAKNWAEAGKALAEAYRSLSPVAGEKSEIPPVRLNRSQRRELRQLMRDDPSFAKLSDRHIRQLISLVEQVFSWEHHHLPVALRFSNKYVQQVQLRRRGPR